VCCTDASHHVDCLDSSEVVNSRRQYKLLPADFAEARMHFRELFLPNHLLPSNLRPLAKSLDDDRKRKVVSVSQVLVLQ
jgi:hypothetical protein